MGLALQTMLRYCTLLPVTKALFCRTNAKPVLNLSAENALAVFTPAYIQPTLVWLGVDPDAVDHAVVRQAADAAA